MEVEGGAIVSAVARSTCHLSASAGGCSLGPVILGMLDGPSMDFAAAKKQSGGAYVEGSQLTGTVGKNILLPNIL